MTHVLALPKGTELVGDFRIEHVLGAGGFGITYLATETALARLVTIKEYFPTDFAARAEDLAAVPRSSDSAGDYQWGLDRFLDEAKTLARFDHRHICRVHRYFRANNTGYMVLQFEEGASLKGWIKTLGRAPRQAELDGIVAPLLEAMETIHAADFLHRDIAPDNIMIRADGSPVLIDFGSARGDIAQLSRKVSALVKPGYSPYEQYAETGKQQGAWTDIYAFSATLYHCITGKRPPDSPSRIVKDEMASAKDAALSSYRPRFLSAIDKGLALDIDKRPQTVAAWRADLLAPSLVEKPVRSSWLKKMRDPEPQPGVAPGAAAAQPVVMAKAPPVAPSVATVPLPRMPEPQPVQQPVPAMAPASAHVAADAPRKGGLLDFLGAGKRKSGAPGQPVAAVPAAAPAASATLRPPPPPPQVLGNGVIDPTAETPVLVKSNARLHSPTPPPVRRKAPRPQPVPDGQASKRMLVKGLVVLAVGSAAYGLLKDKLPRNETRAGIAGVQVVSSASKDSGKSAKESKEARDAREAREAAKDAKDAAVREAAAKEAALKESTPLTDVKGHSGGVNQVVFSDDGKSLLSVGADKALKIWNATSGALSRSIDLGPSACSSVAVQGRRAITGHADGSVHLWDIDKGTKFATFRRNEAAIWSVAFAGGPGRILAASHDWSVTLWDEKTTLIPVHIYEGHESAAQAVAYTAAEGPFFASGSADKNVKLWNPENSSLIRTYKGHKDFVTALSFSSDGRTLASGSLDGGIRLWSTTANRLIRQLVAHKVKVTSVTFSPVADVLASADEDGMVRLWDHKKGRTARTLTTSGPSIQSLAFTIDGRRLAVASNDGTIKIWDASLPKIASKD